MNLQKIYDLPTQIQLNSKNLDIDETKDNAIIPVQEKTQSLSIELIKSNIIIIKNSLMLVGVCAKIMSTSFDIFLSEILCTVMEKAGDSNVLISYTANVTLKEIGCALGYRAVDELIEATVPQFWFTLSLRLRRLEQHPASPLVLKVALMCGKTEVRSFTEELVEEVLSALDLHYVSLSFPLLNVLLVYTATVANYIDKTSNELVNITENDEKQIDSNPLINFINEYHKNKEKSKFETENIDDTNLSNCKTFEEYVENKKYSKDVDNADSNDSNLDDEKKKSVPNYVKLLVSIFERCSHLLFIRERKNRIIILDIIYQGCSTLSNFEDEALPAFYKIWKPLMLCLKDKDFIVMLKALEVCVLLIKSSGDFFKRQIVKDVLPSFIQFLKNQSYASLNKNQSSEYNSLPAYKAQRSLLKQLPEISLKLKFSSLEIIEVLENIFIYVDTRQPAELCKLATDAVILLYKYHPHHVWLILSSHHAPFRLNHPNDIFKPIKVSLILFHEIKIKFYINYIYFY